MSVISKVRSALGQRLQLILQSITPVAHLVKNWGSMPTLPDCSTLNKLDPVAQTQPSNQATVLTGSECIVEYPDGVLHPREFRDLLVQNGAIMLRGAADTGQIDRIRQKLDDLFAEYSRVSSQDFERHLASDDPVERDFWQQIKLGHIYDRTFKPSAGLSFFDVIRENGLWDLAARAFPEASPTESVVCNCRRMTVGDLSNFFDKPLDFHVDAQFFSPDHLSVNFWTPLMDCGKDAPGLRIIQLGVQETKNYLEFNGAGYQPKATDIDHMSKFRCEKMTSLRLEENGLMNLMRAPQFKKGDILAFTNFTMHGTYFTSGMTIPRTSIEVRVDLL
ncbi:MAG: phytanoyl-CoA dioxygenase family protein [Xanthobacteraceae bacterium]